MIRNYTLAFALVSVLAAKEIRFQTDEATWMSVDVSPNGQTLVFDMLGDLYTVPVVGGKAKAITSGSAFDAQPRFSPDGKQIAFTSDRDGALNLWLANVDGTAARQLSKWKDDRMFSTAWLPDGKSVLVSVVSPPRQGAADLWRYPVDGGPAERIKQIATAPALLVSAPAVGVYGVAPSRDGAYLYWASVVPRIYNSRGGAASEIVRRDLRTGQEESLTARTEVAFKPLPSPDGRLFVYATHYREQTALKVRDLETQEDKWLKIPVQRDELEARATRHVLPDYAFTPDSKALIISYGGKIHRLELASGKGSVIPFTADVAMTVEARLDFPVRLEEGPVRARIAQRPSVSPDLSPSNKRDCLPIRRPSGPGRGRRQLRGGWVLRCSVLTWRLAGRRRQV